MMATGDCEDHEPAGSWEPIIASLVEALGGTVFPTAAGETIVTLPMTFGGPVRALQR